MKALFHRLRRLENTAAPAERELWESNRWGSGRDCVRAAVEAIIEARRRRLGADYVEPIPFPKESYAGCRTSADRINRVRELLMARQATRATHGGQGLRPE
jgi:hypothetical protein